MSRWWEERLDVSRLREKYLRKAFPVHHTFFLGEITLCAFAVMFFTGLFLVLNYVPSGRSIEADGQTVPLAYASVKYIDSLPFGRVLRSVHHWSSHIMVAAAFLHLVSKLLSGGYKKPREITWLVGVGLLGLAVVASFTGYALPDDAFSVTATRIAYGIAASVPWIGTWLAGAFFGGDYPTLHSLPRLYAIHILLVPLSILALVGVHLLLVVKHKHQQPGYARWIAPGRVLGMPMVPEQALVMTIVLLLFMGVTFVAGGLFDVHPVDAFGPPGVTTPDVKPDWYFLWIYGLLQMVPSAARFRLVGGDFGPEFFGGVVLPALLGLAAVLLPFVDRSRRPVRYLEAPSEHGVRSAIVVGLLVFFFVTSLAGYHSETGISIRALWVLLLVAPLGTGLLTWALLRRLSARMSHRDAQSRVPYRSDPDAR